MEKTECKKCGIELVSGCLGGLKAQKGMHLWNYHNESAFEPYGRLFPNKVRTDLLKDYFGVV